MVNIIWLTRPKRKLDTIPEVLATVADASLNAEWQGQLTRQLSVEQALESAGLKRVGERRDQRAGGARTYIAWLKSLGLLFEQESTKELKLTLAGEAIINGEAPVEILKAQVIKYQFPSSFAIASKVSDRFRIHPFWFLLKLLRDSRLEYYLTQEEIGKIFIEEADSDSDKCYNRIVSRIIEYRNSGDSCLADDFFELYSSARSANSNTGFTSFLDCANTIINWLDYTQLIYRDSGKIKVLDEKEEEVDRIIAQRLPFIDRPEEEEYFQRKYGIDIKHNKDTRNLTDSRTITPAIIAEKRIKNAFIALSVNQPIYKITNDIIAQISNSTGIKDSTVEDTLLRVYPNGAIGSFMTNYFQMAFKGRDEATDFEKATAEIFRNIFNFTAYHVGPIGLTPDVEIVDDGAGYQGIIDNKAYHSYSISNDHHNRMVHNYIRGIESYRRSEQPLAFFSYIAGGFGKNISTQLEAITAETGIKGSALSVSNFIKMIERQQAQPYTADQIRAIFSKGRQINISDIQ